VADNVILSAGTADGVTLATDDIGGTHYQIVKISFGALDTATPVSAANPLPVVQTGTLNVGTVTAVTAISNALPAGTNNIGDVDVLTLPALAAGTNNIGDVDVLTVPTDPFGANADAASATGSISAKLRFIASTGIPITGTASVNVAQMNGVTVTMGNGASGTGVQRVTLANDSTGVLATVTTLTNITNWGNIVDDAAFTPATTRVLMVGYQADETATDSVDEGDGGAARMTLDRKQITTAHPHTQGGLLIATGSITNTATAVKASAGQVYGWYFYNPNASVAYVQFFNTAAASVTLGTTTPVYSLGIPATSGANVMMPCGIAHSTAIAIGVTTTRAGSTAPGSSVDYNIFYF